jgi:hypothetical protein
MPVRISPNWLVVQGAPFAKSHTSRAPRQAPPGAASPEAQPPRLPENAPDEEVEGMSAAK